MGGRQQGASAAAVLVGGAAGLTALRSAVVADQGVRSPGPRTYPGLPNHPARCANR